MALTVTMPQLGESVTEGTIARWLKQPGDAIAKYESIAEVITDKVNAEIPAPADGVMAELIAPRHVVPVASRSVPSRQRRSHGRAPPAPVQEPAAVAAPVERAEATPVERAEGRPWSAPRRRPMPRRRHLRSSRRSRERVARSGGIHGNRGRCSGGGSSSHEAAAATASGRLSRDPAVRMLVREHGVDLSQITGSGIGGRISKKDVLE